ncbi:MAG: polyphosphate kinase 2 [Cocleimonas sp.]|nr:polyphosphate kinase 2 [Cocleimonas sp.]
MNKDENNTDKKPEKIETTVNKVVVDAAVDIKTSADNGNKKENTKKPASKIKLTEGIALRNCDKKKGSKRVAVHIKKKHLKYEEELKRLQVELMKLQLVAKKEGLRIVMLFEGRDAAGKGGTIKRIISKMNARGVRVVALEKPNDQESSQWYFQRYIQHLPSAGEIVIFDRSWYNRAMVEPVMDFCTDEQHKRFLKAVPMFEELLVKDGISFFKFYFSVSKKEQQRRFKSRETDLLKQYKLSPVDKLAQKYWNEYSIAKFQMLNETNRSLAPWTIVRSDDKKNARINCIKHILTEIDYEGKTDSKSIVPDPKYIISGIDEIQHMEENLMNPDKLYG